MKFSFLEKITLFVIKKYCPNLHCLLKEGVESSCEKSQDYIDSLFDSRPEDFDEAFEVGIMDAQNSLKSLESLNV